ncbi:NrfD/PsrC family molybdoenzyme membrane anchor subunit [Sphaerobacter thermophilus]|uniref:Polysulphide reductase NrfD n=1 Tax=Sphaerobacter thermophilus (strain ATCC 49802 / DSM 20745 / KCCM 41009 / NCIMB 13125 / S 6022) TaxID=479434 RepID=D1CAE7_SPHTD|nr:NrfD/PsrC family molybdoenzyme membrane anchor subunit [Sphaerobacter thermophilus]ACZ40790.1 Polysulphide reductase NrfD [Sphaerobacter thermophilus DSM 20745]
MPDTFFTQAPHWQWWIIFYFFIGGIGGGSYAIAAMLHLFGEPEDRPISRLGYYIALPAIIISGILLTLDLTRPERFWHMLVQSNTWTPAFKYWSPMSVGSWGITFFGLFAFLSTVGALAETRRLPWRGLAALNQGLLGNVINVLGALFGFFVAGYTGVLLSVTNRPLWADTWLLGLLFLVSGFSTAAALLYLAGRRRAHPESLRWLSQMDTWALILELIVLALVVVSVGSVVAREVLFNMWGVLLLVGVVLVGILIPLLLHWRPRLLGPASPVGAAALVLVGGFILRVVMLLSSEAV